MPLLKSILNKIKNMEIEKIENENGTAIKFADGTMICTGTGQCPASAGHTDITFPASFVDMNYVMSANHKYTSGSQFGGSYQLRNNTTAQITSVNSAYIYSYLNDGNIADYPRNVQYIAIGKWK